jgi:hypothetical protein
MIPFDSWIVDILAEADYGRYGLIVQNCLYRLFSLSLSLYRILYAVALKGGVVCC